MSYLFAGKYVTRILPQGLTWGDVIEPADSPVSVFLHGTVELAALYTDRTKAEGAPNPVTTDFRGLLTFWAVPGAYDLVQSNGDVETVVVSVDPADVPIGPVSNPFATVTDVTNRLGDTANPGNILIAAALDDASAVVRTIANRPWADPTTAPAIAKTVTLRLVLTAIRNPDGYLTETDGDYSYTRAADYIGPVSESETDLILAAAGRASLQDTRVARDIYIDARALGLAAVIGGGDPFPLGIDPLEAMPWTPGDPDANVIVVDDGGYGDGYGSDFG